jgi:hypothetical protein
MGGMGRKSSIFSHPVRVLIYPQTRGATHLLLVRFEIGHCARFKYEVSYKVLTELRKSSRVVAGEYYI